MTSVQFAALCGFLLAVTTPTVMCQQVSYPLPPTSASRSNPSLTLADDGRLVLSWVTPLIVGYQIGFATSTDDGQTWNVHDSVLTMRAYLLGLQRRPVIRTTGTTTLVCAYLDSKVGDAMPRIYVSRSTDGGDSWLESVPVVRGFQSPMQDFMSMGQGADGTLVMSFLSADSLDPGTHVFVVTSTDGGQTWSDPRRANIPSWEGNSCECCMTSAAIAPNGTIGVAFRANRDNVRDVYLALQYPGATEFAEPVRIQNQPWSIDGCPATGPSLTFDRFSMAHVSWRDYRDAVSKPVVYYARYAVGAPEPPSNIDVSSAWVADAEYPAICTSDDGGTFTILHESIDGVRLATGGADGKGLGSEVVDQEQRGNANTSVVRTPNKVLVGAWTSKRNGRNEIKMLRMLPTSIRETTTAIPTVHAVEIQPGESATVFDLLGRTLACINAQHVTPIHNTWYGPVLVRVQLADGQFYSVMLLRAD